MVNKVTICNNIENPNDWQTFETNDVICKALLLHFDGKWPDGARLYYGQVSDATEHTPRGTKAEIAAVCKHLNTQCGEWIVVVWPQDPITVAVIVAIAVGAVAIGLAFLLRPKTPATQSQSSNNQLGDRQNKARPNERINDIFGTVRCTPDLLQLPYRIFDNENNELEISYMCASRGSLTIYDCRDDLTDVANIDGEFVAVYGPNTSPNGAAGAESTPQVTFGTAPIAQPKVVSIQQSSAVNGQILRAPNSGNLNTNNNVAFQYPDTVLTNGSQGLDFTDYFVPSTVGDPQYLTIATNDDGINASDPGGHVSSVGLAGTYQILDVSSTAVTLSSPASINANWNVLSTFTGQVSTYDHSFSITQSGSVAVGQIVLNIADLTEVWANFVEPAGLYYIDSSGNQKALTVTIQMTAQAIDQNLNPIGDPISGTVNLVGSQVQQLQVGATLKLVLPSAGAVQVSAQRMTNKGTDNNTTYVEQIQWRDLFGVSPVAATNFGNVTTCQTITKPTPAALGIKERKINMLVTRNIPTYINRGTVPAQMSTTLYPSNCAADIICALALDPFIGRRAIVEVDIAGIYEVADNNSVTGGPLHTAGTIQFYFGTPLATEFCYTFDDFKTTFEETLAIVGQCIGCTAYRQGSVISIQFEQKTSIASMLFNHRSKVPNSETRTITFGTLNDNDGITLTYIDPQAPNAPDQDSQVILYFPTDQSAQNPKNVDTQGIRNPVQAMLMGWRYYQKLLFTNTQTDFTALQEAALCLQQMRVLVADDTRPETQAGEIIGLMGITATTSQPVVFAPSTTYTMFLQLADGSIFSTTISLASGSDATKGYINLGSAPSIPLITDESMYARTPYIIVAAGTEEPQAFLIQDKEPQDNGQYKLSAVNYDDNYYVHDTDIATGALLPPTVGYLPPGYTGHGLNGPALTVITVPRKGGTFSLSAYTGSPLETSNNVSVKHTSSLGPAFAGDKQFTVTASQVSGLAAVATGGSLAASNVTGLATVATSGTLPAADVTGLATVATTGAYSDLTGKPTIPAAQVNSDWIASSGVAQILNKPTLAASATTDTTNAANISSGILPAARISALPELTLPVRTITANYTLASSDYAIRADATSGNLTITLPTPAANMVYAIKKIDSSANTITISGGTIDGNSSVVLNMPYVSVTLQYDTVSSTWGIY